MHRHANTNAEDNNTDHDFNAERPVFIFELTTSWITKKSHYGLDVFRHNPHDTTSSCTVSSWH